MITFQALIDKILRAEDNLDQNIFTRHLSLSVLINRTSF